MLHGHLVIMMNDVCLPIIMNDGTTRITCLIISSSPKAFVNLNLAAFVFSCVVRHVGT